VRVFGRIFNFSKAASSQSGRPHKALLTIAVPPCVKEHKRPTPAIHNNVGRCGAASPDQTFVHSAAFQHVGWLHRGQSAISLQWGQCMQKKVQNELVPGKLFKKLYRVLNY
jgi:hypothetical protein